MYEESPPILTNLQNDRLLPTFTATAVTEISPAESIPGSFLPFLVFFIRHRILIVVNVAFAGTISLLYALYGVPVQYGASLTFLPPYGEKPFGSFLSALAGGTLNSQEIIPEQIVTIFESNALRRRLIETFDLYTHYGIEEQPNRFTMAIKRMKKDLILQTNEVGSMGITKLVSFTISAYHASPDTSYPLCRHTFTLLDSVLKEITIDRGRRSRVFVENQLSQSTARLDSLQRILQEFQLTHKAFHVPQQIQLSLSRWSEVQAHLLTNTITLTRLRQEYSSSHPEIASLEKENQILKSQLIRLEREDTPDVLIGLERSTDLAPRYLNLWRDIEVQNRLILFLSQELEEAKLREAKDYSCL